jgi:hypothetical protein
LTPDDILALQYCPNLSKQKIVPLSQGYHTHVTRFKAMYSEGINEALVFLQLTHLGDGSILPLGVLIKLI